LTAARPAQLRALPDVPVYRDGVAESPTTPLTTPGGVDQVLVAIGDITITSDSVVVPQGRYPLRGTTWAVADATRIVTFRPTYAIVLTSVFAVTLLGLLFLLIRRQRLAGHVSATVVGEGLYHSVTFPPGPESTAHVASLVNQARALAAAIADSE
jgi:hypothetical protein